MARFPLLTGAPLKTPTELEEETHDARLVGIAVLVCGATTAGVGVAQHLIAAPPGTTLLDNVFVLLGALQTLLGAVAAFLVPAILRRRWIRQVHGR